MGSLPEAAAAEAIAFEAAATVEAAAAAAAARATAAANAPVAADGDDAEGVATLGVERAGLTAGANAEAVSECDVTTLPAADEVEVTEVDDGAEMTKRNSAPSVVGVLSVVVEDDVEGDL